MLTMPKLEKTEWVTLIDAAQRLGAPRALVRLAIGRGWLPGDGRGLVAWPQAEAAWPRIASAMPAVASTPSRASSRRAKPALDVEQEMVKRLLIEAIRRIAAEARGE